MTPSEAVATGHIEGPDHTPSCGRGAAAGPYASDLFTGLYDADTIPEVELIHLGTVSAQFQTPEGLGVGSTRAEIIAALGEPAEEMVWPYTGWAMWYDDGQYGIRFRLDDQAGSVISVTIGYDWALRILWDC
jgi:hypothetical protein